MGTHTHNNKTSTESGLLLSFLKVYQVDTGHFLCKDKYYGRKLSPEGFRQALRQFLCNGNHLRTDVLEPIILQLKALLSVIRKQSSYRFYSSSLLIIYDGLEHKENIAPLDNHLQGHFQKTNCTTTHGTNHARVDVRMIDFAHTTFKGSKCNHTTYDGPDHGYIFGLENLIKILQNILEGKWRILWNSLNLLVTDIPGSIALGQLYGTLTAAECHVHGLEWEHGQLARKNCYVPLLNWSVKSKELKESVLSAINQKIYFPFLFYCCPWFICKSKESITWKSLNDKIGPVHLYHTHKAKQAKKMLCIWVRLLKWAGRS